jgi:Na+/H+-dicarboxylate symporter
MNGTALYEAVAVIFIAQLNGKEMTFVDYVLAR